MELVLLPEMMTTYWASPFLRILSITRSLVELRSTVWVTPCICVFLRFGLPTSTDLRIRNIQPETLAKKTSLDLFLRLFPQIIRAITIITTFGCQIRTLGRRKSDFSLFKINRFWQFRKVDIRSDRKMQKEKNSLYKHFLSMVIFWIKVKRSCWDFSS